MKKIVLSILAHVDAGKTTLSESILFHAGTIRKMGRVDNGDTALDTHDIEKSRGITVFAGQAKFKYGNTEFTLLDTPGHVDFSGETERMLGVSDYAVLVISATEGVQSHTRTLWRLLSAYSVPTFIFITKNDFMRRTPESLMAELRSVFGNCINFSSDEAFSASVENIAESREDILDEYLETGKISDENIISAISDRLIFPCYFGSGLRGDGVEKLLCALDSYTRMKEPSDQFSARVFKISHDKNDRLTHMKILGGALRVRDSVKYGGNVEKISAMRLYNGAKFSSCDEALPGEIVAVTGLSSTSSGQMIYSPDFSHEEDIGEKPYLEPVMRYRIGLPEGADARVFLLKLRQLEEEDPLLKIEWNERLSEIYAHLMGEIQAEILKSLILERFGIDVTVDSGRVVYKETITDTVEGVGHFEPLRHYAEVHLLIEPLPRDSGIVFSSNLSVNDLDLNWQRLILQNLAEKQHLGVLTGSPLTDVRITVAAGKAHIKHTEGGDFRQATYRAVRQGLMGAKSQLLEPYYAFTLEIPPRHLSRAINDIRLMCGEFDTPEDIDGKVIIKGKAPVTCMDGYAAAVASYTGGEGRLFLSVCGYGDCHDSEKVINELAYEPQRDLDNTPDSVFCAHGGGFQVKWNRVSEYMHLESVLKKKESSPEKHRRKNISIEEKELEAIMLREFGPIKRPVYREAVTVEAKKYAPKKGREGQYLIVDGYNVIFAWDDLKETAESDLEGARETLMNILANYAAFTGCRVVLVFDAYNVSGGAGEKFDHHGVSVVYTKENETGDAYIEKLLHDIGKNSHVRVVTSDRLIQLSAVWSGVMRMSSAEFEKEIDEVDGEIEEMIKSRSD